MIKLQTLQNIKINELLDVFNVSFADYIVPFNLTKEQLEYKIKSDGIHLDLSVGAFDSGKLVGFILHGFDILNNQKIVYNAGTGIIPSHRGKKLTVKLYEFIVPILKALNVNKIKLEVITENLTAIRTYENIGFVICRKLTCYKGVLSSATNKTKYSVRKKENYDWSKFESFWDFQPSWQNSVSSLEKIKRNTTLIGVYDAKLLLGYLIFNPKSNRVQQFAVDKSFRNKGLATELFNYVQQNSSAEISIINIEDNSAEISKFLDKQGLINYINQYEMELILK